MASSSLVIKDYRREIPGRLSEDGKTFLFPTIQSINAHKKQTEWRIVVRLYRDTGRAVKDLTEDDFIVLDDSYFDNKPLSADLRGWIKVYSKIGPEGKVKKSDPTVVLSGKYKNKSNATNVLCQTLRDALGLHNKQLKKAVSEQRAIGSAVRYPPMLAQLLKDNEPLDFTRPIKVQRKYNGLRAVSTLDTLLDTEEPQLEVPPAANINMVKAEPIIIMYSRKKNLFPGFQYIKDELMPALEFYAEGGQHIYLDGELYAHGRALQDISGYARREDKPGDFELNYMIYDCFDPAQPDLSYENRKRILDDIFANFEFHYCKLAETFNVDNRHAIDQLYNQFLEEGYEGAMVRLNDPYRYSYNDYHCKSLLKMKPTLDAEFEVVGYESGLKGKAAGALMIICKTDAGIEFPVTPAMELPDRIELYKKMSEVEANGRTVFDNKWRGHKIIVYFDEVSRQMLPQRARTKLEKRDEII